MIFSARSSAWPASSTGPSSACGTCASRAWLMARARSAIIARGARSRIRFLRSVTCSSRSSSPIVSAATSSSSRASSVNRLMSSATSRVRASLACPIRSVGETFSGAPSVTGGNPFCGVRMTGRAGTGLTVGAGTGRGAGCVGFAGTVGRAGGLGSVGVGTTTCGRGRKSGVKSMCGLGRVGGVGCD